MFSVQFSSGLAVFQSVMQSVYDDRMNRKRKHRQVSGTNVLVLLNQFETEVGSHLSTVHDVINVADPCHPHKRLDIPIALTPSM